MSKLAAILLGYMFIRPRAGVMGADGAAVRDQRQGGKWHGRATNMPIRQRHGGMTTAPGSAHTHSMVDPTTDPSFVQNPDGSYSRAPAGGYPQDNPYGNPYGYPYDPTMMDPAYAQQYYGGVAYPGQDYGGYGPPVAYGGYANYGSYGGGGDFGSDLDQYQADLQAWMDQ